MGRVEARLQELGITLPTPPAPVASYVPFVIVGNVVHVSGQVSVDASGGIKGKLGDAIEVEQGQAAARLCGLNLLAQVKAAVRWRSGSRQARREAQWLCERNARLRSNPSSDEWLL